MGQPIDDGGQPATKTFTQEELDRIVDQRLARERKKFADYDDLRAKATAADQQVASQKSDMDKVMAKLEAADKRAAEADRRALHGEVVAATGLSMAKVGRLKGETVEELMTDATEVFDWKPKTDNGDGDKENDKDKGSAGGESGGSGRSTTPPPRERLVPDPGARGEPRTDDPIALAEKIPRLFD